MADFSFSPLEPVHTAVGNADAVLAAAHLDAEQIRSAAQAEGYAAGQAAAMEALAPALTALEQTAAELRAASLATGARLEEEAIELAFALAEKIVAGRVESDPETVLEAIRGALRGLVERERVTVLVHPGDLELVRRSIDGLLGALGGVEHCEIQAERRVSRGGALVRYAEGEIDAGIETKLERAREAIAERRRPAAAPGTPGA